MNDILSQYRRPTPASGSRSPAPSDETEQYIAFAARDNVQMMRILVNPELEYSPSNNILLDVTCDGKKGTYFIASFSIYAVEVNGRNLEKVIHAVRHRSAEFIQKYEAGVWPEPSDKNAPFISSIKVHFKESGQELPGAG